MPDLDAIMEMYQAHLHCVLSGALPDEASAFTRPHRDRAIQRFLDPRECGKLPICDLHRRKAELRFRRWQHDNPDIDALLRRKALHAATHGAGGRNAPAER